MAVGIENGVGKQRVEALMLVGADLQSMSKSHRRMFMKDHKREQWGSRGHAADNFHEFES